LSRWGDVVAIGALVQVWKFTQCGNR